MNSEQRLTRTLNNAPTAPILRPVEEVEVVSSSKGKLTDKAGWAATASSHGAKDLPFKTKVAGGKLVINSWKAE